MRLRSVRVNKCGVFAAIGLGLNLVWCTLMGHTMGFMSSAAGIEEWVNPRIFFLAGILVLAVLYIILPRALKHSDRVLRYVLPLLSAFGTACFGLSYHQTFFDPGALAVGVCSSPVSGISGLLPATTSCSPARRGSRAPCGRLRAAWWSSFRSCLRSAFL